MRNRLPSCHKLKIDIYVAIISYCAAKVDDKSVALLAAAYDRFFIASFLDKAFAFVFGIVVIKYGFRAVFGHNDSHGFCKKLVAFCFYGSDHSVSAESIAFV